MVWQLYKAATESGSDGVWQLYKVANESGSHGVTAM